MEKVYGCGELDYTSESICLRDFFNDVTLQPPPFVDGPLRNAGPSEKRRDVIFRDEMTAIMGIELKDAEFTHLKDICSAENFKLPGFLPSDYVQNPSNQHLYSRLDLPQKSDLVTHLKRRQRQRIHERYLKYAGTVWLDNASSSSKAKKSDIELVPGSELLVVIRFYAPFNHKSGQRTHRIATGWREIAVLGCQTLADLRDVFPCVSDNIICQDLSSDPNRKSIELAKEKYKSGMMYIAETFYDDLRCESNLEYSEEILKWSREKNLHLGGKAKMETTKIIDLTVKLGYPYMYQHQGNCEHLFCFSDLRLLHQSDPLLLSKYPALLTVGVQHSRYCMMCGHYVAKWVTVGNSRVPHDPCYFCQQCFLSYNYIDKKKIGEFAAYPFTEASCQFSDNVK